MAKQMLLNQVRLKRSIEVPVISEQRITVQEIKAAEIEIIKYVQANFFKEEMNIVGAAQAKKLKEGEAGRRTFIKKKSDLYKLDPLLVNGLLCVGGRLGFSPISQESMNQII